MMFVLYLCTQTQMLIDFAFWLCILGRDEF